MMQRFTVYRPNVPDATHGPAQKNAPDEAQFEGVVLTDGRVIQHWLTKASSICVWNSFADLLEVHGHPEYGTYFVWHDGKPLDTGAIPSYTSADNHLQP